MIKKTESKLAQTGKQLLDAMNKQFPQPRGKTNTRKLNATSGEIAPEQLTIKTGVRKMMQDWKRRGHSHIDLIKTDGIVHICIKNFSSLSIKKKGGKHWKLGAVDAMRKK